MVRSGDTTGSPFRCTLTTSMPRAIGKYLLFDELASGGMGTVFLARALGPAGLSRTVAVKRMHAQLAKDPSFVGLFMDEARLTARVHHPNVVSTLEVLRNRGELFLVMEYVHGESLACIARTLKRTGQAMPPSIAVGVMVGVLEGLHAAHVATDERGRSLDIVHRDVSPQNILLGGDGVARLVDFGVAKSLGQVHRSYDGELRGKIAYMAKEQLIGAPVDCRADVYSASVVLWEMLTGTRLFSANDGALTIVSVLEGKVAAPSTLAPGLPTALDALVLRGLDRDPLRRPVSARAMARDLEAALRPAGSAEIGPWTAAVLGPALERRAARIRQIESRSLDEVRARRASIARVAAGAALAVLVGVAAGLAFFRLRPPPGAPRSAERTPTAATLPAPVSVVPISSTVASTEETPSATAQGASSSRANTKWLRETATAPGSGCSPPYVINSSGVRIPKPACLE